MNKYTAVGIIIGVLAILSIVGNLTSQDESSDTIKSDTTEKSISPTPIQTPKVICDPAYPDFCIPPNSPDLDCGEIPHKNFRVIGNDKHGFDIDNDGIGCES